MTVPDNPGYPETDQACWTIQNGFCANRANGMKRCPQGYCAVTGDPPAIHQQLPL